MLERSQVEQFLKLNGVPVTAPDEEIQSVLVRARWGEKDVETALLILRENINSHETHVDSLRKVFQTDTALKPETITALLGIDMFVSKDSIEKRRKSRNRSMTLFQGVQIILLSLILSGVCIVATSWYMQIWMFHISMR